MKRLMKILLLAAVGILALAVLTGCKASKKKVLSSEYYKELNKKYEELQKENTKLQKQVDAKDEPTEDEKRATDYLDKITRDSLVKLEVGHSDNMKGSEFVNYKAAFQIATQIASRADITTKYTPESLAKSFECIYEYVLYDENNAVYEIMVYEGDYVVFGDLPNNVYYSYQASALGDAFLHYKNGYPNSSLFHRLADSALITTNNNAIWYDNRVAVKAANYVDQMEKSDSSEKKAVAAWKASAKEKNKEYKRPSGTKYVFYHHGNKLSMTIYDKYISVRNMDDSVEWYQADEKSIKELKEIFQ